MGLQYIGIITGEVNLHHLAKIGFAWIHHCSYYFPLNLLYSWKQVKCSPPSEQVLGELSSTSTHTWNSSVKIFLSYLFIAVWDSFILYFRFYFSAILFILLLKLFQLLPLGGLSRLVPVSLDMPPISGRRESR